MDDQGKRMISEEHIGDLLPLFVLKLLEEDEKQQVRTHLLSCESCQQELASYQETLVLLSYAAPQVDPPPALKAHVLSQTGEAQEYEMRSAPFLKRVLSRVQFSPAVSLAGIILIVLLVTSNVLLWRQSSQERVTPTTAITQVVNLTGTEAAPEASGLLLLQDDLTTATLIVQNLEDQGGDMQYQLWLIEDGVRTSGAVFSVKEGGEGIVEVTGPKPIANYDTYGITVEPYGGSPGPTGAKVLGVEL